MEHKNLRLKPISLENMFFTRDRAFFRPWKHMANFDEIVRTVSGIPDIYKTRLS